LTDAVLIDKYMPRYDVCARHSAHVSADAALTYAKLRVIDLNRSRGIRWLFALRTLPSRLGRGRVHGARGDAPRYRSFLESALAMGWVMLEEIEGSEMVMGTVTQPWKPVVKFAGVPASEFLTFDQPGFAKIAWSIAVAPDGAGSLLQLETRVVTTDAQSRQLFGRYWMVFGPFIKLVRRMILGLLKRDLRDAALNPRG
jgi:hypothetical protein